MNLGTMGERIQFAIKISVKYQNKLARELGVAEGTLVNYIGNKTTPGILVAMELADLCSVSLEWLAMGLVNWHMSEKIRDLRINSSVSLDRFAQEIKMPQDYLFALEERCFTPSISFIKKVSQFFNVTIGYLLFDEPSYTEQSKGKIGEIDDLLLKDQAAIPLILEYLQARKVSLKSENELQQNILKIKTKKK